MWDCEGTEVSFWKGRWKRQRQSAQKICKQIPRSQPEGKCELLERLLRIRTGVKDLKVKRKAEKNER